MMDSGMANYVIPGAELGEVTNKIARRMANIDSELLMLSKTSVNRIFDHQGFSHTMKSSGEFISLAHNRKALAGFNKLIREKGIKAAIQARDKPFGGIDGRYPPVDSDG
ncbi:MAG: hypothetical protein QGF09_17090 [Rhodospirillales bacterium]|nr:hypothetical protein [Rhodospirillales bacterium]